MKKDGEDKALREHVLYLLEGGGAHAKFDEVIANIPSKCYGQRPAGLPYSFGQKYIGCRSGSAEAPRSPDGRFRFGRFGSCWYSPLTAAEWNTSVKTFRRDLNAMQDLVKDHTTDLFAPIAWGDGQTVLREALLLADHNAYHLGQLLDVRRLLGAWPEK